MVRSEAILDLGARIAAEFKPARIVVFGSHAYGSPDGDSDVDMLVVMAKGPDGYRKAAEISERVKPEFPVDLLVRTSAVIDKRIALNDFFLKEIMMKGIVIHDAADARVGRQGRKRLQQRGAAVSGT